MKKKNLALLVAGLVFALVALLHLARVVLQFEVVIAGVDIPVWVNVVSFVVATFLSIWMFQARRR